jgi:diguanylate cyclase (GGDEF)-like protein
MRENPAPVPGATASEDTTGLRTALAKATGELATLYAALDQVDNGVILLDHELRAQFSNRAVRRLFNSPDDFIANKPLYSEMLQHARRSSAYAVSPAEMDAYVAHRLELVVAGDPTPLDQRLSSGKVVRSQCAILPGGGRMLTYNDITDIVRHAEDLERLATTDGMTGIFNRRHFLALADREWGRSLRYERPLSFLMIDIDLFKSVNDRFGHDIGDKVIVHMTTLAREGKRDTDVLARVGGEEFALLLPETDLQAAQIVAERLRADVAANPLFISPDNIPTTVSIGVATNAAGMSGVADLMKAADQALYDAKRTGRNRVICHKEPSGTVTSGEHIPLAPCADDSQPQPARLASKSANASKV